MDNKVYAPVFNIDRHRIEKDGSGIRTLVAFYGCPLKCKFCLNDQCHTIPQNYITTLELLERTRCDDIYFRSSNGGITFGGGEPLLRHQFISEFAKLCPKDWNITVETSLSVPIENLKACLDAISNYIIDLKCLDADKYLAYTQSSINLMLQNLQWLVKNIDTSRIVVRIPDIPGITSDDDIADAIRFVSGIGITNIDRFKYVEPDEYHAKPLDYSKYGKNLCGFLKQLRTEIATKNGMIYTPVECRHTGPCVGTCPQCDYELNRISCYIHTLESQSVSVIL